MDILLVDGYNIIGAWPELEALKKHSLADARSKLIEKMSEYCAYTGMKVIIVFDAHMVKGLDKKKKQAGVEIIYTKEMETADERIEKLAQSLQNIRTKVYVATSDYTEQWTIFSKGALRKSARELLIEMESIEKRIEKKVKKTQQERFNSKIKLSDDVAEMFEKWRRGDK
ncbi:NYN domain-containing protein [Bacillus carboniphilus]|uniref:NYN domain-containing protein n=1 Tax=Bacillus carboniphilus TaxID=86663 RepID=A0ABY9JT83_9BACI|nr:NYN domain-containing protein [Bacillus carboniphilus]WLR41963.1 NYN domain-containing protein [Bacillus carboniphilus]